MRSMFRLVTAGLAALMLALTVSADAARTEAIRDDDFKVFQQGEFEGVALSSDGYLFPSHARKMLGDTGAEIVWAVVDQGEKGILCATGHGGKLVRIKPGGEVEELGAASETQLTAMLAMPDGTVLIAAAPTGQIYRFTKEDKIEPYAKLDAKFVWKMARDAAGTVWAATGTEGRLFKIVATGGEVKVEESVKLPSTNLIDLWVDEDGLMGTKGALYVAGERPGYLYRHTGEGADVEVVYDAQSDEIRAIEATPEGLVIATNSERSPTPQALQMTLRMSGAPLKGEGGEGGAPGGGNQEASDMGDVFGSAEPKPQNPVSRIIRLRPDGFAEGVWASPERPIHAVRVNGEGEILVAAGGRGRIFKVTDDRHFSLIADTNEDFMLGLTPVEDGWLVSGARNGVVYHLAERPETLAVYRSRVLGAQAPVRWGQFHWRGELGEGTASVAFRQGNALDPEKGSWGPWGTEHELSPDNGVAMPSEPSRFVQYRLTLKTEAGGGASPRTDYVEAFFQDENRPPRLRNINVAEAAAPAEGNPNAPGGGEGGPQQANEAAAAQPTPTAGRRAHSNTGTVQVTWNAVDPNQDELEYALYFKADDEAEWKEIEGELRQVNIPLQVKGVADGRYRFRVVATDRLSNPPGMSRTDEIISDEFVVDNSAPEIVDMTAVVEGRKARLSLRAIDALSIVTSVEVDIDNDDTFPLFPVDGLFDQREESVDWTSGELKPGEHVVTVAATDRAGNTEVRKVIITIPE